MKSVIAFWFAFLATGLLLFAQDPMAAHRIQGLEGLKEVQFVTLPNDSGDRTTMRMLGDSFEIALARKVPELKLTESDTAEWLELSWIIAPDSGATIRLSVLRWVRLEGSSKPFMATVWSASGGLLVGKVETKRLADAVDQLVIRLAADYLRANPPRR